MAEKQKDQPARRGTCRIVLACQVLFLLMCGVMVFSGNHPPAQAQSAPAEVYGLEIRSAVQQTRMDGIIAKQDELKAAQSKMWDAINANTNALAGIHGLVEGVGAFLGFLQVINIVQGFRKVKGAD